MFLNYPSIRLVRKFNIIEYYLALVNPGDFRIVFTG